MSEEFIDRDIIRTSGFNCSLKKVSVELERLLLVHPPLAHNQDIQHLRSEIKSIERVVLKTCQKVFRHWKSSPQ